jgi:murein L,D-transpeptidase YcbB/YkuD
MNRIMKFAVPVLCIVTMLCALGCSGDKNPFNRKKRFPPKDTTITAANAYSQLSMDSNAVAQFIATHPSDSLTEQYLHEFYYSRNYQFAWFTERRLSEQAVSFWNLLTSYVGLSKDSTLLDKDLAAKITDMMEDTILHADAASLARIDMGLTQQFFHYAQSAYSGRLDPTDLQWFIPRKKVDALALLNNLLNRKTDDGTIWEPVNPAYERLKKWLERYNSIADKGGWEPIEMDKKKTLKPGDKDALIVAVKARLYASGELSNLDTLIQYDSTLVEAVKRSQRSFGIKENGIIDYNLVSAWNVPVKQRIEQMLINLERMRWLPENPAGDRILVNIPEFVLHVYEADKKAFDMNIVVGKEGSSTVIFNDMLKYVVFSPYWNVPRSIVRNEIVPAMNRDPGYLARNNMESTGNSGGLPVIRQKPGPKNSLGLVKFLFPNNYNIYFHDTPSKSLFNRDQRAFSHGCIRLAEPEKMAIYLLRDQPDWTTEKIKEAMHDQKEKWVTLKNPVPVYITYFTSWVDETDVLHFRKDIYGHDKKMAEQLFLQPALKADTNTVVKK